MENAHFLQDIPSLCMITACVLVFPRWLWMQFRMSNTEAFMSQIEKLVKSNNLERAIKLCNAIPEEPLSKGTRAVLKVHMAGQDLNETEVIDTFHEALRGGSVRASMSPFRGLKTISFFVAVGGLLLHLFGPFVHLFAGFWITTLAFFVMFGSATSRANNLENGLQKAVERLMALLARPDEEDPGVDAGVEGEESRGEGYMEIREAYEDVESSHGEIHAGGIEALLLAAFKKEHGLDLKRDENAMKRIRDAAQKVFVELAGQPETEVSLPFLTADERGPLHLQMVVDRRKALVFSRRHVPASGTIPTAPPAPVPMPEVSFPSPPSSSLQPAGKAVVCRNCSTPLPVEPELLAQIEGEFDLWTKVKSRCPKCGGSFFELQK
ncbi:Hsp70 family protein [Myxococcota bacterium]|nr:Hsp70 family protein [Myxococcota bacterium]